MTIGMDLHVPTCRVELLALGEAQIRRRQNRLDERGVCIDGFVERTYIATAQEDHGSISGR